MYLNFKCYFWYSALSYKLIKDKYIFVLMHFMLEGIQKIQLKEQNYDCFSFTLVIAWVVHVRGKTFC